MYKICLVIPNSVFLLDARVFPFLGILKVASAFEKEGAAVDVLDLSGVSNWPDVVSDYFSKNSHFDFVGITATTPQMPECYKVAQQIRSLAPGVKIVLGGPHGTAMNAAARIEKKNNIDNGRATQAIENLLKAFDIVVCGDGELLLQEIIKTKSGLIDADDRLSQFFLNDKQVTDLPLPARHLIDLESYKYTIDGHKATSLITQLGCPFKCFFCGMRQSPSMRITRNRTIESIVEEVEWLYKTYNFTGFMVYDDEMNINSKILMELLNKLSDLQSRLGVDFAFRGFLKSELTTEEQLKAMKRVGFSWLLCGFESGNERILKNIEKNATVEDNTRFLELAKKHNLKTKALMSLGQVGESPETIEDTKNWLLKVQPEDFDATVITTFGGSPYYDFAKRITDDVYVFEHPKSKDKLYQKVLDYTKDADYYKGQLGAYTAYVWTDHISAEDLVVARDNLENEVRAKLNIPFNPSGVAKQYEHSMGQGNILPDWILRSSETHPSPKIDEVIAPAIIQPQVKEKRKLVVV